MKRVLSVLLLWVFFTQSFAAIVFPAGDGHSKESEFIVELKLVGYFYRLNIYDRYHILLDSSIQFSRGEDLDTFIIEGDNGNLEVMVVMSLDDATDVYDTFSFDGNFLSKIVR